MKNYKLDEHGVLHQIKCKPFFKDYGSERNGYGEKSKYLSYLRLGYILGCIGSRHWSILDIGFGNGDFLRACQSSFEKCAGFDVIWDYIPEGCIKEENILNYYDVITMFDSYEHFDNLDIIKKLNCQYLVISVPNCKHADWDEWLADWKHLRPDEHLHHFGEKSLCEWLEFCGYYVTDVSYIEDVIRKDSEPMNILTVIAQKL